VSRANGVTAYQREVAWAYSLAPRGIRLELDRMRTALRMLGSPERGLKVIHVAGTNGKGSVSAMIERGLRQNGLRTGLYTSPHLHTFTERVRIDGRPIAKAEATARLRAMRAFLARPDAPPLTFFEVATLLALLSFRDHAVDVVVLEVGLGGRLDATNVISRPMCTVITRIALDHQQYLGASIASIAAEKAGILKRGVPCVSGVEQRGARRVVAERAEGLGAPLLTLGAEITAGGHEEMTVSAADRTMTVRPPLSGRHQRRNTALAAAVLMIVERRLRLRRASSALGIERTVWPGRLELISGRPAVLLDAAHNPDGASALARHLSERPAEKRVLVFGAMRDKDWRAMLDALAPHVDGVVCCAPEVGRAEDPAVLAAHVPGARVARDVRDALRIARRLVGKAGKAGKAGLVVVCGSIFVLAAARAEVLGIAGDPPIAM
jgi:dihydrofolate synthase / folylpolyglutamate synthase